MVKKPFPNGKSGSAVISRGGLRAPLCNSFHNGTILEGFRGPLIEPTLYRETLVSRTVKLFSSLGVGFIFLAKFKYYFVYLFS